MSVLSVRRGLRALTATTALAASLTLAAPAHAESTSVSDGADTPTSLNDILDVTADHRARKVVLSTTLTDLQTEGNAWLTVYFDTNAGRRGPEFGLGTPLFSGSSYQMFRMRDWRPVGAPLDCSYLVNLDWEANVLGVEAKRGCLGGPAKVRVGMRMQDFADEANPVTDWMTGRRKWTDWLSRA